MVSGARHRYGYGTRLGPDPSEPAQIGLIKYDLQRDEATRFDPGEHRFPGEPVFVRAADGRAEDEGWVLTVVFDATRGASDLVILDGTAFGGLPVATVHLPARVPYGLHGSWVPTEQLEQLGSRPTAEHGAPWPVPPTRGQSRDTGWPDNTAPDPVPACCRQTGRPPSHRVIHRPTPDSPPVPPFGSSVAGTGRPAASRARPQPHPSRSEFTGPILSGQVAVPSRRERRRARKRRRRPAERILRGFIVVVLVLLLVTGLGYGYFRYQWSKVSSSPCDTCVAAANGQPYNILLIGSDSRAGETAAQAQQFGSASNAGGQRSDTIKIIHVDPAAGTASSLSIPRDTYVTLSGLASGSPLSTSNKINAAFSDGPDGLIKTIQNTFGIPISHYIEISFFGVMDAVNALGGISMDFPYPVRDHNSATGVNESGLDITRSGCQVLNGSQALSLSRSRYFQYYANGQWIQDPTSDIGRIQRQNMIISAAINQAKSTYNPLRLNALLTSVVHDFSKDDGLTPGDLFGLAERYHAFSGSQLRSHDPAHGPGRLRGGRLGRDRPARLGGRRDQPIPGRHRRPHHHPAARRRWPALGAPGRHHDHHRGAGAGDVVTVVRGAGDHPDDRAARHSALRPPPLLIPAVVVDRVGDGLVESTVPGHVVGAGREPYPDDRRARAGQPSAEGLLEPACPGTLVDVVDRPPEPGGHLGHVG